MAVSTDKDRPSPFIHARRMMICLACYRTEAWMSVIGCAMSCWTFTGPDHPITLLLLSACMAWIQPPWHSIVFESAYRLVGDFTVPTKSGKLTIALSGAAISILSLIEGELLPALIAALGAAIAILSAVDQIFTPTKPAPIYENSDPRPKKHTQRTIRLAGALTFLAWAIADYTDFSSNKRALAVAGSFAFLSQITFHNTSHSTRTK